MLGGHARRRATFPGERVAVAAEASGQRRVVEDRGDRMGEIGGNRYWSVMITSRAVNDRPTSIARHSRVNSSITTRIRSCLPSSVRSVRKS